MTGPIDLERPTVYGTLAADSSKEKLHVPIFPSCRLLVTFLCLYGTTVNFASQGLIGATLLTMWRFNWDRKTTGWILSSFFLGYFVVQFPVGWLVGRFGGKNVVLFGAVSLGCLQIVAIPAARLGSLIFQIILALAGMTNGLMLASIIGVLGAWVPRHESSRLTTIAMSGAGPGTAIVYSVSAATSKVHLMGGWPFNFITIAVSLLVFSVLWGVWVTDTPAINTRIKETERTYIHDSISPQNQGKKKVPWRRILTSLPVVAVSVAQFGTDWILYTMITVMPPYFKHVQGMQTHEADMLCGLPWLGSSFISYAVSKVVDTLRERGRSTTLLRKACDFIAKPLSASLLVTVSFLPPGHLWLVGLLYTLAVFLTTGFINSSHVANTLELTPQYAGIVFAVSQVIAMTSSFLVPLLVSMMTPHNSPEEWRQSFGVLFGMAVGTFVVYGTLGSTDRQDWNPAESSASTEEDILSLKSLPEGTQKSHTEDTQNHTSRTPKNHTPKTSTNHTLTTLKNDILATLKNHPYTTLKDHVCMTSPKQHSEDTLKSHAGDT